MEEQTQTIPEPHFEANDDGTFDLVAGEYRLTCTKEQVAELITPIPSLSQKEIEDVAEAIFHGRAFCSYQVPPHNDPAMCFMVLALMDEMARAHLLINKITFVYEYMDKAGPRSVNGMPCFFSMRMVNADDAPKIVALITKMRDEKVKRNMEDQGGEADTDPRDGGHPSPECDFDAST